MQFYYLLQIKQSASAICLKDEGKEKITGPLEHTKNEREQEFAMALSTQIHHAQ